MAWSEEKQQQPTQGPEPLVVRMGRVRVKGRGPFPGWAWRAKSLVLTNEALVIPGNKVRLDGAPAKPKDRSSPDPPRSHNQGRARRPQAVLPPRPSQEPDLPPLLRQRRGALRLEGRRLLPLPPHRRGQPLGLHPQRP
ncbi:hypothetical protein C0993_011600, partial [Termitomyces sp. T159_Od127]